MYSKRVLKDWLRKMVPEGMLKPLRYLYLEYGNGYAVHSYAQEGEDLLAMALFENRRSGFYVDVGAHHPKRFSNTRIFYESGWTGINIEPNPEAMKKFRVHRKKDINLCVGVGIEEDLLEYFVFDETAMNTFDRRLMMERVDKGKYKLLETRRIPVQPLKDILEKWGSNRRIDFLNVDAEGMDLEVLQSNDWDRFRPRVVLVEILETNLDEIGTDKVLNYLTGMGYHLVAKTMRTGIFESITSK